MKRGKAKVFGIGLSKTGTTSLAVALERMGYRVADFPWDDITRTELEQGEYKLSIMQHHDALTDIVASPFFAQYDRAFPGSKFVLTVREVDAWLKSIQGHWEFADQWAEHKLYPAFSRMSYFIRTAMYGNVSFCEDRYARVHKQHELAVRAYFKDRPDDLLVMDVTKGDGYPELCAFLDEPLVDERFPRSNSKSERETRQLWLEHFLGMVADMESHVPEGKSIVLIDDGPFASSTLTERWDVHGFSGLGGPGGMPESDANASARLSQLCDQGVATIVLPWSAFWWREHYPDWLRQLNTRMTCICKSRHTNIFHVKPAD